MCIRTYSPYCHTQTHSHTAILLNREIEMCTYKKLVVNEEEKTVTFVEVYI